MYFSVDKSTMNRVVNANYQNSVAVSVSTIDNILAERSATAIKIDVDGYEGFVLEGAENTLTDPDLKVIVLELNNSGKKIWFRGTRHFRNRFGTWL